MKQAWLTWARHLSRCFHLLGGLPSRMRNELGAMHQMEAEVSRMAQGEQIRHLQELVERVHREVNEQLLILMDSVASGGRHSAEMTLRSQLPPPPARAVGLSVLIPCWNQGCLLTEAATSALASLDLLGGRGEVLILDDASRDETRQKANELVQGDDRVRLLTSALNLGLPRARNVLLSQARFEHALPLDADNQLVPTGVAALYRAACETGAVMAYGNLAVHDDAGRYLGMLSNDRIGPQLLDQNYIDALVILRTGRLLELNGYNTDRSIGFDDWELNVRLLHGGEPMVFVPTIVALYRRYALSMVHDAACLSRRSRNLHRVYGLKGRLPAQAVCASMYHPATGYIWQSPAWTSRTSEPALTGRSKHECTGPRLLVVSSAGVRNHGDDAILLSILERLRRVSPGALPVVITDGEWIPPLGRLGRWAGTVEETCRSLDPADIRRGCEIYPSAGDLAGLVGAGQSTAFMPVDFSRLGGVLFAGGGNLTDQFPELTARRAALAAVATAFDLRYIVSGQGIGPITGALRDQLALLVAGATHFGVRDPLSLAELRLLPVSCDHAEIVGDDALGLAPGAIDGLLQSVGVPQDQPLLGFHAREANYVGMTREDLQATATRVDELAAQNGQSVVCLPINTQPWAPETVLLTSLIAGLKRPRARWFLVDAKERVDIVAALVARCSAVVSHSYHVALFALAAGVPVLLKAGTEYYRRKAEGLRQFFQVRAEIGLSSHADTQWMSQQLRRMREEAWCPLRTPREMDEWLGQALWACVSTRERLASDQRAAA